MSAFGNRRLAAAAVIFAGLMLRVCAQPADADPVRLAVLVDAQHEAEAEWLTVFLSQQPAVEVVDRAEIRPVLREHAVSITSSGEGARLIPAIAAADGIIFLQNADSQPEVMSARLVRVRDGTVLSEQLANLEQSGFEAWAEYLYRAWSKTFFERKLQAEQLVPLSFQGVFAEGHGEESRALEKTLSFQLRYALSAASGLVVLERRQLHRLAWEQALSVETNGFATGVAIVRGRLSRDGERLDLAIELAQAGRPAVVLTVDGRKDAIPALIEQTARAIGKALTHDGGTNNGSWDMAAEAQRFFDLSRWAYDHHLFGEATDAIEASIALGNENRSALALRISSYSRQVNPWAMPRRHNIRPIDFSAIDLRVSDYPLRCVEEAVEYACAYIRSGGTIHGDYPCTWPVVADRVLHVASSVMYIAHQDGQYPRFRERLEALRPDMVWLFRRLQTLCDDRAAYRSSRVFSEDHTVTVFAEFLLQVAPIVLREAESVLEFYRWAIHDVDLPPGGWYYRQGLFNRLRGTGFLHAKHDTFTAMHDRRPTDNYRKLGIVVWDKADEPRVNALLANFTAELLRSADSLELKAGDALAQGAWWDVPAEALQAAQQKLRRMTEVRALTKAEAQTQVRESALAEFAEQKAELLNAAGFRGGTFVKDPADNRFPRAPGLGEYGCFGNRSYFWGFVLPVDTTQAAPGHAPTPGERMGAPPLPEEVKWTDSVVRGGERFVFCRGRTIVPFASSDLKGLFLYAYDRQGADQWEKVQIERVDGQLVWDTGTLYVTSPAKPFVSLIRYNPRTKQADTLINPRRNPPMNAVEAMHEIRRLKLMTYPNEPPLLIVTTTLRHQRGFRVYPDGRFEAMGYDENRISKIPVYTPNALYFFDTHVTAGPICRGPNFLRWDATTRVWESLFIDPRSLEHARQHPYWYYDLVMSAPNPRWEMPAPLRCLAGKFQCDFFHMIDGDLWIFEPWVAADDFPIPLVAYWFRNGEKRAHVIPIRLTGHVPSPLTRDGKPTGNTPWLEPEPYVTETGVVFYGAQEGKWHIRRDELKAWALDRLAAGAANENRSMKNRIKEGGEE